MENVSQAGGTVLDTIVNALIPPSVVAFLNTTLYRIPFFILNYWSFVHFIAGIFFYALFPKKFRLWVGLNIAFEAGEYLLGLGGNPLFVEETVDITLDVLWSLGGFLLAKQAHGYLQRWKKKRDHNIKK